MIRYEDIKKFPSDGRYNVDVNISDLTRVLDDYKENYDLDLCPDFQRGNVWTDEQRTRYMEFLMRGGVSARTLYFNHPGWMTSMEGQMVCLDGLQRITTVLMFLEGKVKVFGGNTIYDFEDQCKKFKQHTWFRINVNNMETREEILNWYIDYNSGGTVHSEEEINRVRNLLKKESQKMTR